MVEEEEKEASCEDEAMRERRGVDIKA